VPAERIHEVALDPEARARLAAVAVLFITGSDDPYAPPDLVRSAATAIEGSQVREMPGLGHVCFWEDPGGFVELLEGWFAAQER